MIFFDIDGTLVDHDFAAAQAEELLWRRHFDGSSLSLSAFRRVLNLHINNRMAASKCWSFLQEGPTAFGQFFAELRFEITEEEVRNEFQIYVENYRKHWRLFGDAVDCLNELEGPLGAISNGDTSVQREKLTSLGIADRFSVVLMSEECQVAKPGVEIFRRACAVANVVAADCFYIGDSYEFDVVPSRQAGMKPIWLNRNARASKDPTVTEIDTLSALADTVASWRKVSG